mmetsp:Transcript_9909/g.30025  ORF Transcript_9909/g.30025 Transcript_9909/m.30025 type:complete len:241 (+) Transcript_9909:238-960(+)
MTYTADPEGTPTLSSTFAMFSGLVASLISFGQYFLFWILSPRRTCTTARLPVEDSRWSQSRIGGTACAMCSGAFSLRRSWYLASMPGKPGSLRTRATLSGLEPAWLTEGPLTSRRASLSSTLPLWYGTTVCGASISAASCFSETSATHSANVAVQTFFRSDKGPRVCRGEKVRVKDDLLKEMKSPHMLYLKARWKLWSLVSVGLRRSTARPRDRPSVKMALRFDCWWFRPDGICPAVSKT